MSYSIHRLDSDEIDVESATNTPEIVLVQHPLHPNVAVCRQLRAPTSPITRAEVWYCDK